MSGLTSKSAAKWFAALAVTAHAGVGFGALSDLTQFEGLRNTPDATSGRTNNYTVTSATSAGGSFQPRINEGAYLADRGLTLTGPLSATGTFTFEANAVNSTIVDPIFGFGFFNDDNLANAANNTRAAFTLADQTATSFRVVVPGAGAAQVLNEGTYTFTITYDPAAAGGTLKVDFGAGNPSFTGTGLGLTGLDSFGFIQMTGNGTTTSPLFAASISNVEYTGGTPVPEPAALGLLAAGGLAALRRGRR